MASVDLTMELARTFYTFRHDSPCQASCNREMLDKIHTFEYAELSSRCHILDKLRHSHMLL